MRDWEGVCKWYYVLPGDFVCGSGFDFAFVAETMVEEYGEGVGSLLRGDEGGGARWKDFSSSYGFR